jgi:hypothetical protein
MMKIERAGNGFPATALAPTPPALEHGKKVSVMGKNECR